MQIPPFEVLFWFIVVIGFVIYACYKLTTEAGAEDARRTRRPINRSQPPSASHSSRRSSSSKPWVPPARADPASSPIGGTCLNCGAVFEEETELLCPGCGVKRERCPICQRFVAGSQDLLSCPHCQTIGHANELEEWVQQKRKCPYCAKELSPNGLVKPKALTKA